MLKKILYTVLFVALAAGTVYSWQKVNFNRKTAMFFQTVFGDQTSMAGPGGRPPMSGNGQGAFARGGNPGNGGPGGPGGHGGPGGSANISLGNVAGFTVIMAFVVMLTRLLDRLFLKRSRARQPS